MVEKGVIHFQREFVNAQMYFAYLTCTSRCLEIQFVIPKLVEWGAFRQHSGKAGPLFTMLRWIQVPLKCCSLVSKWSVVSTQQARAWSRCRGFLSGGAIVVMVMFQIQGATLYEQLWLALPAGNSGILGAGNYFLLSSFGYCSGALLGLLSGPLRRLLRIMPKREM